MSRKTANEFVEKFLPLLLLPGQDEFERQVLKKIDAPLLELSQDDAAKYATDMLSELSTNNFKAPIIYTIVRIYLFDLGFDISTTFEQDQNFIMTIGQTRNNKKDVYDYLWYNIVPTKKTQELRQLITRLLTQEAKGA